MSADETAALGLVEGWMSTNDPLLLPRAIEAMGDVVAQARSSGSPDLESEFILAHLLISRAEQTGLVADIETAILLMRRAADDSDEHRVLSALGRALVARFQRTDEQSDLDEALDMLHRAVEAATVSDPGYPVIVTDLLQTSWLPLSRFGDTTAITAAIEIALRAICRIPDQNPGKLSLVIDTAQALSHRHSRTENANDVESIIDVCRQGLNLAHTDSPERLRLLASLGDALLSRYDHHDDPADLDEAITILRFVLDTMPDGRSRCLFDLARALHSRFARDGRMVDMRQAVDLMQRAVAEVEPDDEDRHIYQAALIAFLSERSKQSGDAADRDEEIAANRHMAQRLPTHDPQRELSLSNLGRLLYARYEDAGDVSDLTESIDVLREAVDLAASTGDIFWGDSTRVHLAFALVAVFNRTGDVAALDEALEVGRTDGLRAVQRSDDGRARFTPLLPADDWRQTSLRSRRSDQHTRATLTSVLAQALSVRYEQIGDLTDLDDAQTLATTALELAESENQNRETWMEATHHLSRIHALRHLRTRDRADLDRAVDALSRILATLPQGHHHRSAILSNLTALLIRRFDERQDPVDLDQAVQAAEEALEAAPGEEGESRARAQKVLAHVLLRRHRLLDGVEGRTLSDELARAVELARMAVSGTPEDTTGTTERLSALIVALRTRYDVAPSASDLAEVIDLARKVLFAESDSPTSRLETVEQCADWAARHGEWVSAAELYSGCVDMMIRLASLDRHSETRRYWLTRWTLLTQRASASAINAGDPQTAAVLLDRGRGVLLSQTLDLREDMSALRSHDYDLADRIELLRRQLDDAPMLGGGQALRMYTLDNKPGAMQDIGANRRRLLHQFDELLAEIRSKPGFEQYLRPTQWADLVAQSEDGPVVLPNISDYRSDALIISSGSLRTVELLHATPDRLRHAVGSMQAALERSNTAWRQRDRDAQLRAQSEIGAVLAWLWDSITEPILGALDLTEPPASGQPWRRMWWVPTGLLSLLPLHAAQRGDQCALDRVIASYAPTIRALRIARDREPARVRRILAVAMPNTPGAQPLPFADREAVALAGRFGEIVTLSGPQATRDRVRAEMHKHTWAHFACHGLTNLASPGADLLLLHDHRDRPFTTSEIARLHLDSAELAYLSACETARTPNDLADEAVHLGSAFQLAGYRHVVATLWAIRDDIGAELADLFYAQFLNDQSEAAVALHHASRHVREKFVNFPSLWASHLHIGP